MKSSLGNVPLLLVAIMLFGAKLQAQSPDVTFVVVGKHASYVQEQYGALILVDHSFFSEIFLTPGGEVTAALLTTPGGRQVPFVDQRKLPPPGTDNVFLVAGDRRYETSSALASAYPDGEYRIALETPDGEHREAGMTFAGQGLPAPPKIGLSQGGQSVRWTTVDPDEGLLVGWSPFSEGRSDPNKILDDLIFVIVRDCRGRKVVHSGRPFATTSFLTYRARDYRIPADVLEPGTAYTLQVEHALLVDRKLEQGMPALATYAVTTTVDFLTKGTAPSGSGCDEVKRAGKQSMPGIDSNVVMLYYKQLDPAAEFYGEALGLEKTLDWDWVKFFRTSASSYVGLVEEGEGAYHKVQPKNAVMLSIVTREVDAWHDKLKRVEVPFLKEIANRGPIRSFMVRDPGGYTVEFFQWLQEP